MQWLIKIQFFASFWFGPRWNCSKITNYVFGCIRWLPGQIHWGGTSSFFSRLNQEICWFSSVFWWQIRLRPWAHYYHFYIRMICIRSQCFCSRSQLCALIVTLVRWAILSSASVFQAKRHIWRHKSHPFFAKSELEKNQIGFFKFGVLVLMLAGPFTIYIMWKCKERLIVTNRASSNILDATARRLIRKGYLDWIHILRLHFSDCGWDVTLFLALALCRRFMREFQVYSLCSWFDLMHTYGP